MDKLYWQQFTFDFSLFVGLTMRKKKYCHPYNITQTYADLCFRQSLASVDLLEGHEKKTKLLPTSCIYHNLTM